MIPEMKGLSYEERLRNLGLYLMESRRLARNLIETYRILSGLDRMGMERMLPLVGETRTRGHNLRVKGCSFKTEIRRNFFSLRVVNLWSSLPQRALEDGSLSVFKTEIDRSLINKAIKGYREKTGEWG